MVKQTLAPSQEGAKGVSVPASSARVRARSSTRSTAAARRGILMEICHIAHHRRISPITLYAEARSDGRPSSTDEATCSRSPLGIPS